MINTDDFVWVELNHPDDFLKVKETLTRIGIASRKDNTLWQSCHILHKKGSYAIVHFKELFALDGKPSNFSESDKARRNTIANLLAEWGLVRLTDENKSANPTSPLNQIKILPFSQKSEWNLEAKYNIGKKKGT